MDYDVKVSLTEYLGKKVIEVSDLQCPRWSGSYLPPHCHLIYISPDSQSQSDWPYSSSFMLCSRLLNNFSYLILSLPENLQFLA